MSERTPLPPRLRELDGLLAARGMPAGARNRVEARLHQEVQRRAAVTGFRLRWLPALTFAAGAALVMVVIGARFTSSDARDVDAAARRVMDVFTVQGEGCRARGGVDEEDTVLDGTCRLVSSAMVAHSWSRVRLRRDRGAVEVREGTIMFDVESVEAGGAPVRIRVSHGIIEVLGTRFTIEQEPRGGHVDLFEGRIRFVGTDGSSTEIAPGQRYTWGETIAALTLTPPPVPAPGPGSGAAGASSPPPVAPSSDGPPAGSSSSVPEARPEVSSTPSAPRVRARARAKPRPSAASERGGADSPGPAPDVAAGGADEAQAIIEEVDRLRARGRYADAAGVLRRADRARRWDRRTAQVLSYELGEILERHLGDDLATCRHWARHQRRFAGGRYDRAISDAQERLGCGGAPSGRGGREPSADPP